MALLLFVFPIQFQLHYITSNNYPIDIFDLFFYLFPLILLVLKLIKGNK